MRIVQILALLLLSCGAAADEWKYQVVPYYWWPNFQAESGGDVTSPPSDDNLAFSTETKLDAGFLIYTSATKNRHVLSFEFDWVDINTGANADFPLFPEADIDWELFVYTLGYGYKIVDGRTEADGVTVGTGARYFDVSIEATFDGRIIPDVTAKASDTWTDGFIDIRGRRTIGVSGKWYVAGLAMFGGGGSDKMVDYGASLGYQWSDRLSTSLGYRMLEVEIDDLELTQDGAIIAIGWTF